MGIPTLAEVVPLEMPLSTRDTHPIRTMLLQEIFAYNKQFLRKAVFEEYQIEFLELYVDLCKPPFP